MKLVFTALFSLLAILAAPSAETSSVSMGGLAPHFYIEAEDRAALSYNRASTPFCFGLYIGSTNQPPSEFELVCLFTNAAMGPNLPQGFTLGKPMQWGGRIKEGPYLIRSTNYSAGMTVNYQVRGWFRGIGGSYEEALANDSDGRGLFGQSQIGMVTLLGGPLQVAPFLFGTRPGQVTNFVMRARRK